jgi:hypothetical protein
MSDKHAATALVPVPPAEPAVAGMSPVVALAMRKDFDPEVLRELLAMQREYEANEARKQFTVARKNLADDLPRVLARDKKVEFGTTKYTHTTLGAAIEAVVPHLIAHGFSHDWRPGIKDGQVMVTCRLTHVAGHFEEVTLTAPPDNKGSKNGAQAIASTITMLERYTLLALLGIATADMEEPKGDDRAPVDPNQIDTGRNMAAVAWLKKQGRTCAQAEEHVKRKCADWTAADLQQLAAWAKAPLQDPPSDE